RGARRPDRGWLRARRGHRVRDHPAPLGGRGRAAVSTPRVLVVEDEAGIRLALTGLLRREGYEVVQCECGADALAQLEAGAFDFVLTDLALGDGPSGLDVLRRARERQPETPIVMITAHGSEKIAVEAMKLGAEDYVPKPFDNDEIRLVV